MRTLRRNKQEMKYAIKGEKQPIYELDEFGNKIVEFVDGEGNEYYRESGSYTSGWTKPEVFYGNIAMSGGEAEATEFGLSVADYDSTISASKNELPLILGAYIWHTSEVEYKDEGKTDVNETSADYQVIKVSESLNEVKYILKALV